MMTTVYLANIKMSMFGLLFITKYLEWLDGHFDIEYSRVKDKDC